jgi:1-deoxy-D-xylulose-5-phosphate reductoisomerase
MKLPILYAMTWPEHAPAAFRPLDVANPFTMTFEPPDADRFPALRLAREAGEAGRTYPTVLSAVDEVAVDAFREERIGFTDILVVIETVLGTHDALAVDSLDVVLQADRWAREEAERVIRGLSLH